MRSLVVPLLIAALIQRAAAADASWDVQADTWAATDALGRSLPTSAETGPPRTNRFVGIFYFLWMTGGGPVKDLAHILAANPANPQFGAEQEFHWWGEPLFGYYRSDDDFVIRKHAQMLADAGVDVLIFDVTNALIYEKNFLAVCRVLDEMRRLGEKAPRITFIAHTQEGPTSQQLFDKLYSKNLHPELWFRWLGKPLLLADPTHLSPQLREFFAVRESWAWAVPGTWFADGRDKWPWLDNYPQQPGWHDSKDVPEQISVSVAQHPTSNIGRSFHNDVEPAPGHANPATGIYFADQWRRALQVDPQFIFITGWNEWIAQRFITKGGQPFLGHPLPPGGTFFVDEYSEEYSRDIEPMKGGHFDNYYYQMAANIRRYKGARAVPPVTQSVIKIDGKFADWQTVSPEFRDTIGDPAQREHAGWDSRTTYTNHTGRNDIVASKITWNAKNIYFYARTREPITAHTGSNWMLLFIDLDHNSSTGWLGYDFAVNRGAVGDHSTTLEKSSGDGYLWSSIATLPYRVSGNELELAMPREAIGLATLPATIDFKWADNIRQTGGAEDFTLNGDVAPNDRYNYRAVLGGNVTK